MSKNIKNSYAFSDGWNSPLNCAVSPVELLLPASTIHLASLFRIVHSYAAEIACRDLLVVVVTSDMCAMLAISIVIPTDLLKALAMVFIIAAVLTSCMTLLRESDHRLGVSVS